MTQRTRADLVLTLIAAIWGSTFVIVKGALEDASVLLFLALRFTLGTAALAFVFRRNLEWGRATVVGGALAGLFFIAGYIFQTEGLRFTTASKSGFLTGLYIVLVPLLSALVYRIVPGWREWLGVGMAAGGMTLMTLDGSSLRMGYGDALTLVAAVAFAAHILMLGRIAKDGSTATLSLTQVAAGAVVCWLAIPLLEPPRIVWTPRVITALLITGVIATAFVLAAQTWAQKHTTPTRTALLFALEPVFAAITAFLFAGERFTARAAVGAALILAGILRVEMKPARRTSDLLS
jgi:drug/metabolite transporter (DMT)-like permease